MGLLGKKKEQRDKTYEKSEEIVLKEALGTEVEELQKEFRTKHEEIENVTKKLQSVKEEYDIAISNLMSVKKEFNQKKMELDIIQLEHKDIKSKLNNIDERLEKNRKSADELDKVEANFTKRKQELENITKEYNEIKEKTTTEQSTLHRMLAQQIQAQKELDSITSKLHNVKNLEVNNEISMLTPKEKEFIEEATGRKETRGIIEAASVVVGSLKSKLSMMEKELETVQTLLEKERNEHMQTKKELEKIKRILD